MLVITSLGFQGTSITPQYANLSVVGGKVVLENLGSFEVDDLVNNDLTGIVNTITGGGTLTGYRAGTGVLLHGTSTVAVVFSTPLSSSNYSIQITSINSVVTPSYWFGGSKTVNGFTVLNAGATFGSDQPFDWIALPFV